MNRMAIFLEFGQFFKVFGHSWGFIQNLANFWTYFRRNPTRQIFVVRVPFNILPNLVTLLFFKKMDQPRSPFVYFRSFQTNIITIFTTDQCEKMSCPSSIWCRDLNPQPSEREPPPITTRPHFLAQLIWSIIILRFKLGMFNSKLIFMWDDRVLNC